VHVVVAVLHQLDSNCLKVTEPCRLPVAITIQLDHAKTLLVS